MKEAIIHTTCGGAMWAEPNPKEFIRCNKCGKVILGPLPEIDGERMEVPKEVDECQP